MSTTLTARVSVRVQAKNASQTASQKRDTGKNIAKALGNENISDELADEIGNTTNPTIADENGNEWVSMEDIIAAGKAMYANGAFEETEGHKGLTVNGELYNLSAAACPISININEHRKYLMNQSDSNVQAYALYTGSDNDPTVWVFSKATSGSCRCGPANEKTYNGHYTGSWSTYYSTSGSSRDVIIGDNHYTIMYSNRSGDDITGSMLGIPYYSGSESRLKQDMVGFLFGAIETEGGSLIDWTKTDAEIEEDIRNLHETWDVTEHPGAYSGQGTYILAGPIEYNDADPTQGPPGSVG